MVNKIFFSFFKISYTIAIFFFTLIGFLGPFSYNHYASFSDVMITAFFFVLALFNVAGFVNIFFTGRRFDSQFKNVLVTDENIDEKLFSILVPFRILIRLPSIRALLYSFCIVLPNRSSNNRVYRSWFKGYDFRINSTVYCILLSYIISVLQLLILFSLLLLLGLNIF